MSIEYPFPGKQEFTVKGACPECMHMGWFIAHPDTRPQEVQRCDNCAVFEDDDQALGYALELVVQVLAGKPRRRTGKRYKAIIEAVRIVAWRKVLDGVLDHTGRKRRAAKE